MIDQVDEGVLSDMWSDEELGKTVGLYGIASLLSPVVGPVIGGFLTARASWRWVFYIVAIMGAVIGTMGLLFLRETYAPRILELMAAKERESSEIDVGHSNPSQRLAIVVKISLVRPVKLLATQVIIQVLALYLAFLYGLVYLVLSTFPQLWTDVYGESVKIGSLNYISIGVGFILGSQLGVLCIDKVYIIR